MSAIHTCKNCDKKIPRTLIFCSEDCKNEFKREREKRTKSLNFVTEMDFLGKDKIGKTIELELARGRNVKGQVIRIDNRFGKIVIEGYENKKKVTHIVKISYVVSMHIYSD